MARKTGSHSNITGPRIREVALALFAQHGFAAVSMRKIASEVGVQAGALYLYTPDKQTLLFDLMQSHMDALLHAWAALDPAQTPSEQLEQFARFHIGFHMERPEAVFVAYMELRNLTPENFAKIEELRRRYETVLEDIVKAGQAADVFTVPDSKLATMALIAMLTGIHVWYRDGGRLTPERVQTLYKDLVRRTVQA
jgi:AcrR family transcriptional regulator